MYLRVVLPEHLLSSESKDVVRLGVGLITTMAALVLGLLIASTKDSYDTQRSELMQMSANIMLLDRVLTHYGPETKEARELLRRSVIRVLDQIWLEHRYQSVQLEPTAAGVEPLYDTIQTLIPQNDAQPSIKAQALSITTDIAQTRWLMFEQRGSSISPPFLVVLVFWLAILLVSFGLSAPTNATVIATLFVCALSVAGAVMLILEMDQPFTGSLRISSAPLRYALAHLGE